MYNMSLVYILNFTLQCFVWSDFLDFGVYEPSSLAELGPFPMSKLKEPLKLKLNHW
jgi:hypothetical protein